MRQTISNPSEELCRWSLPSHMGCTPYTVDGELSQRVLELVI